MCCSHNLVRNDGKDPDRDTGSVRMLKYHEKLALLKTVTLQQAMGKHSSWWLPSGRIGWDLGQGCTIGASTLTREITPYSPVQAQGLHASSPVSSVFSRRPHSPRDSLVPGGSPESRTN